MTSIQPNLALLSLALLSPSLFIFVLKLFKKIFCTQDFWYKIILGQKNSAPKVIFLSKIFLGHKYFLGLQFFWSKWFFVSQVFLGVKNILLGQICFLGPNIFFVKNIFWFKNIFLPNIMSWNIMLDSGVAKMLGLNKCWS